MEEQNNYLRMKNSKVYLVGVCLLCTTGAFAQNVSLQPPPQQMIVLDKSVDLPSTYQVNGESEANPYAIKVLKKLFADKQPGKNGIRINIGEKGDKSVHKYTHLIPNTMRVIISPLTKKKSYWQEMMNEALIMLCKL